MRAESLVEMGRIKSKRGETQEASRLFSEALEVAAGRPGVRAMALRGLGVVENKVGRYQKAQELLEASAKEAMSAMDQKGMLLAHLELGNVLIGRGKYPEAIDHFSKCAAGFGPVELTNVYVNMGIACAHLDRTADARLHLENAVKLADDTGQPRAKAYALTSLAEVLTRTGDPERAKEDCFGAIEVFSEIGDRLGMSAAYANLGMAERLTGDLRSSEEHYRESLASLEGMDVPWSIGVRKMEFAQMLVEKGDVKAARKLLTEARGLFAGIGAEDMLEKVASASSSLR
ncbi:MAG: tetratricopeptide repeat protein [Thermoplasmata archaeon]|nr:tetratricopeptide repeat protein [Thermoplasmata archaeon]